MGKRKKLIGQKFGRLTVVEDGKHEDCRHKWECKCECGNIVFVETSALTTGRTQSCGCLKKRTYFKSLFDSWEI